MEKIMTLKMRFPALKGKRLTSAHPLFTWQLSAPFGSLRRSPCMKRPLLTLALVLIGLSGARAQFGSFSDVPIEITSNSSRMENGLAIAEENVVIRYGDTAIYCDYGQYNPDTRDVFLSGNVRLYREGRVFLAERALYNLETKIFSTADFQGETIPFRFGGESLSTLGANAYLVKDGLFTTSDSSKPDYYIRAKTIRIYAKDRVVFSNVRLYVGRTPVFWYPYLYQSLNAESGFLYTPGYNSTWGARSVASARVSTPCGAQSGGRATILPSSPRGRATTPRLWRRKKTRNASTKRAGAASAATISTTRIRGSTRLRFSANRSTQTAIASPCRIAPI
jgi:hypothetical protein